MLRPEAPLLSEMGYSLQGTSKQKVGAQHVDRDAQFRHINDTAVAFMSDGPARHQRGREEETATRGRT